MNFSSYSVHFLSIKSCPHTFSRIGAPLPYYTHTHPKTNQQKKATLEIADWEVRDHFPGTLRWKWVIIFNVQFYF